MSRGVAEPTLTAESRVMEDPRSAVTASTVDAVLFAEDGDPPAITPDEAAVLVEALKDLFYQSYVRREKLRADHEHARIDDHSVGRKLQRISKLAGRHVGVMSHHLETVRNTFVNGLRGNRFNDRRVIDF